MNQSCSFFGWRFDTPLARVALALLLLLALWPVSAVASDLPEYRKTSGVAGRLTSIGSDTLNHLMSGWSEEFRYMYPSVKVEIQGLGSSTAPPALAQGTSNFGPMSRTMKRREIEAFVARNGYEPLAVPVAVDALAVFVHKDNPVLGLSMVQVDAIFSATRSCGGSQQIRRWGDAGGQNKWKRRKVRLYGRNSVSGTYGYFKKVALCKGDFDASVSEQSGSSAVVQAVSRTLGGIGYSGIGYKTSQVRALPLAAVGSSDYVEPTLANAANGSYPLSRLLYVYINKPPGRPAGVLEREFLQFVLSAQGQAVVAKNGYVPLPAAVVDRARKSLR